MSNFLGALHKYKSLFNELDELRLTINDELNSLKENSLSYDDKFNSQINNLEDSYKQSLNSLEERIKKIKDFEINFDKLNELKQTFELIISSYAEQSNEFTEQFIDFKEEIDKKFQDEVKSFRSYTDKEIELELRSLESHIYDRIRKVDRHLERYDDKIYEANQLQEETNKLNFKQLRSIDGKLETIKSITEASVKNFNNDLRNTESHILEKIDIIEERQEKIKKIEFIDDIVELDKSLAKQKKELELENENIQKKLHTYEKQITVLTAENKQLEAQNSTNKTTSIAAIVIAIFSLVLMIVVALAV